MNEPQSITNGELAQLKREETPSGDLLDHSTLSRTGSSDPLNQIAELLTGDETNGQEPDNSDNQTAPGQSEVSEGTTESVPGSQEEPGEEGSGQQEEGGEREDSPGIETLTDAAKALGTSAAKMYDLKVPMSPGEEPVSLGELKDAYRNSSEWQQDYAKREQEISKREVRAQTATQDLAYLQAEIVANLPPERISQMQERRETQLATESALLQQAIPEMKDQQFFQGWRTEAVEYTSRFGFKPHELIISDHRLLVLLNHAMGLEKRLDKLANFKPVPVDPGKRKRAGIKPGKQRSAHQNSQSEALDQVANLVKGTL